MKYAILTSSKTGNTEQLAQAIRAKLPAADCVYCGAPTAEPPDAELIFAGFWTDKGTCDAACASLLETLCGKRVALFGTAGFGQDHSYFDGILSRAAAHLPQSSVILGGYMCQGKMPPSVRQRYLSMLEQGLEPEKMQQMIANFDAALPHPDANDMDAAGVWAAGVLAKASR